jgi:glycosyltransferase involved in cell wall biosynthesis
MSKILIAGKGFSFNKEPRIINQILALRNNQLIGLGDEINANLSFFYCIKNWQLIERLIKLSTPFGFRFRYFLFKSYLKFRIRNVDVNDIGLIVANNLENGVIATILNKPFIFDSHEYLIGQFPETNLWWRKENLYLKYVLNRVLPHANLVTAEGDRVLEKYESIFSLSKDKLMCVPNTPSFFKFKNLKTDEGCVKFIHHGLASPRRGLEIYISIFKRLPENYTLTLMLNNVTHPYYKFLVDFASGAHNINFIPPVSYDQIVNTISKFDVSLVFFNSNNFHHKYMTVPNKFWESLQARLPVVVSFESAMADIINKYDVGFVCQGLEFEDYLATIKNIGHAEIKRCRQNISKYAIDFSNESWVISYNNQVNKIIEEN